jgi:hypothetical protein
MTLCVCDTVCVTVLQCVCHCTTLCVSLYDSVCITVMTLWVSLYDTVCITVRHGVITVRHCMYHCTTFRQCHLVNAVNWVTATSTRCAQRVSSVLMTWRRVHKCTGTHTVCKYTETYTHTYTPCTNTDVNTQKHFVSTTSEQIHEHVQQRHCRNKSKCIVQREDIKVCTQTLCNYTKCGYINAQTHTYTCKYTMNSSTILV